MGKILSSYESDIKITVGNLAIREIVEVNLTTAQFIEE